MSQLLEIRGLNKNFGGVVALRDFDLELRQEESLGLIGPNGAGKSTLLNLIAGVFPPTSGRLWFRGGETTGLPAHKLCLLGIAKTFQITRPFAHLSVLENVTTAAFLRHPSPVIARRGAREWIAWVGLEHVRDRAAGTDRLRHRRRLHRAQLHGFLRAARLPRGGAVSGAGKQHVAHRVARRSPHPPGAQL